MSHPWVWWRRRSEKRGRTTHLITDDNVRLESQNHGKGSVDHAQVGEQGVATAKDMAGHPVVKGSGRVRTTVLMTCAHLCPAAVCNAPIPVNTDV